jgi:Zn finger protein HypA/HybF involved in hydrogenase expression
MIGTCRICQASFHYKYARAYYCGKCRNLAIRIQSYATATVKKAIRLGKLNRPSEHECFDCGKPATQYDHRDYSKPLQVAPVCRSCNAKRGGATNWAFLSAVSA